MNIMSNFSAKIIGKVHRIGTFVRAGKPNVNYSSLSIWTAAIAAFPVSIAGIDANSKAGNSW